MPNIQQIAQFTAQYKETLKWSSSGEHNGEELEDLEDFEFAPVTELRITADCADFITRNDRLLAIATTGDGYDWGHAGHDFWLTRAGHGAGYWDGDLPDDVGQALTDACDEFNRAAGLGAGNPEPYIGDDGLIYILGSESL